MEKKSRQIRQVNVDCQAKSVTQIIIFSARNFFRFETFVGWNVFIFNVVYFFRRENNQARMRVYFDNHKLGQMLKSNCQVSLLLFFNIFVAVVQASFSVYLRISHKNRFSNFKASHFNQTLITSVSSSLLTHKKVKKKFNEKSTKHRE